ncbi:4'-phosphopantetheinyl transferase family protein [Dyadobacter frigoris]|uniref:4'-phosphopantetheinyl transferase superfamily protein n=1 Tax=Dyadobacter frigoris TaxID=2576211 RepID=A0A4U6D190_9BACT|nr:4'-phosphopantetheinyl transferase superfamily protein [Dyadobacter frigoris]TKT90872.1 4'-phosphopantetheinyl transferase superfamily protein [Dyadobacter frigoris]GLU56766.1 hypothetical protein Dfri01_62270 [Dyadobacter frigoris]
MGLVYKKVLSGKALLGLWEITESLEDLFATAQMSRSQQEKLLKKVNTKRKRESLAVQCLVNQMLDENSEISNNEDGKPFLPNNDYHISISHSEKYAVVYLDKGKSAGVDIQKVKPDIGKGIDFFLNSNEQLWVAKTDFILINILWSAKESVYKYAGIKDLDQRNAISVNSFSAKPEGIMTATFNEENPETISIHYEVFEDYVLTRTL